MNPVENKAASSNTNSDINHLDDTIDHSAESTNIMDVNNNIDASAGTNNTSLFTSLNLKVEILEKKYNDLIPLLKDCCDNANELRKTRAISDIVGMAPAIDFNKSDTFVFAKVYIFVKSELVKLNSRYAGNFSLIFGYFEKGSPEEFESCRQDALGLLSKVILSIIKDAPGKNKLLGEIGYLSTPPLYALLEKIRSFHCGSRKVPFAFEDSISHIKYGNNYDNVGAVKLYFNVVETLSLFHHIRGKLSDAKQAEILLLNMDPIFKAKFLSFQVKSNFIKSETGDYFSVFDSVGLLLNKLEEYEEESNFTTNVNNLAQVFIDKGTRLKKKNSTAGSSSFNTNSVGTGNQNSKNHGKSNQSSRANVRAIKVAVNDVSIKPSTDLNARPW